MAKLGITLPCFVEDPETPIAVARAAEAAGVDGVFVFDHIFQDGANGRRPALECFALLGAVAAETTRVQIGTLVARASLRPPATLAHCFDTVERIASGRLIAGIGAGDSRSRDENESFGLPFGTMADRLVMLHGAVRAAHGHGYPVWVGGHALQVRELVALCDGWNGWGRDVEHFRRTSTLIRELAPSAMLTWGGLVVTGTDDAAVDDKARRWSAGRAAEHAIVGGPAVVAEELRRYVDAGAEWVIVAPFDASNPENPALIADALRRLM